MRNTRHAAIATLATVLLSGCAWLREQIAPESYIQSKVTEAYIRAKISPDFVRNQYFDGRNCPGSDLTDEMVLVGKVCVDKYEASIWSGAQGGAQVLPSACNVNGSDCSGKMFARSVRNVTPASGLTWFQATAACTAAGKRLLSNSEWQAAAAGTIDNPSTCNTASAGPRQTSNSCLSAHGVADMIGNLAEWVGDWTQANTKNDGGDVTRPELGSDKVVGIDEAAPESFRLPAAVIRGGSYLDGEGAGVYALDAQNAPMRARASIGFRCGR